MEKYWRFESIGPGVTGEVFGFVVLSFVWVFFSGFFAWFLFLKYSYCICECDPASITWFLREEKHCSILIAACAVGIFTQRASAHTAVHVYVVVSGFIWKGPAHWYYTGSSQSFRERVKGKLNAFFGLFLCCCKGGWEGGITTSWGNLTSLFLLNSWTTLQQKLQASILRPVLLSLSCSEEAMAGEEGQKKGSRRDDTKLCFNKIPLHHTLWS